MFVNVLKRYRAFAVGQEVELTDGVANVLIKRGIVRAVDARRKTKPKYKRAKQRVPQADSTAD